MALGCSLGNLAVQRVACHETCLQLMGPAFVGHLQPDCSEDRLAFSWMFYGWEVLLGGHLSKGVLVLLVRQARRRTVEDRLEGALAVTLPLNLRCSCLQALSPGIVACQLSQPVFLHRSDSYGTLETVSWNT